MLACARRGPTSLAYPVPDKGGNEKTAFSLHIASASLATRERMALLAGDNLIEKVTSG